MEIVQKETNLTEQEVQSLPDLPSGFCFVSSPTLAKTFAVRFRTTFTESPHVVDPFEEFQVELEKNQVFELDSVLLDFLPIKTTKLASIHSDINQKAKTKATIKEITETLERMSKEGNLVRKQSPMGVEYSLSS